MTSAASTTLSVAEPIPHIRTRVRGCPTGPACAPFGIARRWRKQHGQVRRWCSLGFFFLQVPQRSLSLKPFEDKEAMDSDGPD